MKKKAIKRLSLEKIKVAKISNLNSIRAGIDNSLDLLGCMDLTTKDPETIDALQCASGDCIDY